jgi:hypothetical protein
VDEDVRMGGRGWASLYLYLSCFSFFYLGVGEDGLEVGWAVWMGVYGSLSLSLLLLYFYLGAGEEGGRQVELVGR